jgi:di/tricarboxylate transporter
VERYGLADREYRVRVRADSPLLGRTLGEMDVPSKIGARIILIERGRGSSRQLLARTPDTYLQPGDILLLDVDRPPEDVEALRRTYGVDLLPRSGAYFADRAQHLGMVEVVLPYQSQFVGKTVTEAEALGQSELTLVGLRRGRTAQEPHRLREQVLKAGDTVLLAEPWKTIRRPQGEGRDLLILNLPKELDEFAPAAKRAPYAIFTLVLVVALMASEVVPTVHAALIGCLLMGLFRCIKLEQAYRAIQWKTLILIVGMMPFAVALDRTGGVDLAADALVELMGDAGPRAILAVLLVITVVLGLFIVNTANAVLMIPVALAVAEALGASPYPFAMTIALACSAAFMTPISPVNTLVTTAGSYSFGEFVRIGLPLTLMVMAVSVLLVPWLMPLY